MRRFAAFSGGSSRSPRSAPPRPSTRRRSVARSVGFMAVAFLLGTTAGSHRMAVDVNIGGGYVRLERHPRPSGHPGYNVNWRHLQHQRVDRHPGPNTASLRREHQLVSTGPRRQPVPDRFLRRHEHAIRRLQYRVQTADRRPGQTLHRRWRRHLLPAGHRHPLWGWIHTGILRSWWYVLRWVRSVENVVGEHSSPTSAWTSAAASTLRSPTCGCTSKPGITTSGAPR